MTSARTAGEITGLSAADLAAKISARELSSVEVTQAHLDRIAEVDTDLGAFLHISSAEALVAAKAADDAIAGGEAPSPLAGVPIALKDVFTTTDAPTTCGSKILEGWVPPYDATVTERLRAAGIPILGKTNMDEFAMGSSTENSAYQVTRNPWDTDKIPGGSGGGSAAALASYQAPLAIGTDTGGSIRQPAAVTATVGVKPTYGTVSRYGLVACASSLDQGGPCGRTVLDTALLHEVIAGHDPRDSTSIDAPVPDVVAAARFGAEQDLTGVRIGVVTELQGEGYQSGVLESFRAALQVLTDRGAEVVEVSCPHFSDALGAYYLILPSEVSSNLARFDAMRYGLRVGDDPRRRLRSRSQAAHHDRHLRAVVGLLRRLLRSGPEGADPDRARLRCSLREGRRPGFADHPDHGVRVGGEGRRPTCDVSVRSVHPAGEPGRSGRDVGAVGSVGRRRHARRPADHGPRAGRRPAVSGGRRLRGGARADRVAHHEDRLPVPCSRP